MNKPIAIGVATEDISRGDRIEINLETGKAERSIVKSFPDEKDQKIKIRDKAIHEVDEVITRDDGEVTGYYYHDGSRHKRYIEIEDVEIVGL